MSAIKFCDVCNKACSVKNSLIKLKRIHNERPNVCDVCNKAFCYKNILIKHKGIHSGECHYTCEVYNKAFS